MSLIRHAVAVADAVLCTRGWTRSRYRVAILTANGKILPVETASFRSLANAEWWIHDWAPSKPAPALPPGCQWIIQDLP